MKRASTLLVVVFLAALLIVLARWLSGDDEVAASAAAPSASNAATAQPSGDERAVDAPRTGAPAARSATGAAPNEAAATTEALERVRASRALLVLDARTGLAVEGASVRYDAVELGVQPTAHRGWSGATCDEWLRADGPRAQSDAAGRAELDTTLERGCVAVVQHDARIAREHFLPGEDGLKTVQLVPDAELEVLVIGPDNGPLVGAEVALRSRMQSWSHDRRLLRSDSDGRVRFAHVGLEFEPDETGLWSVALVGLVDSTAEVRLEPNDLPREPVVLRAGAAGAVEVAVTGLDGQPLPAGFVVLEVDESGTDAPRSFWKLAENSRVSIVNGLARFEHVRLGESLWVVVEPQGAPAPARKRIDGPRASAELVRVEVRLGEDQPLLALRLLDEAGAPLVERSVMWRIEVRSEHGLTSENGQVRSDGEGRLLFALADFWNDATRRSLVLALDDGALASPTAVMDVSREFAPGRHELGDLTLRLPPIVAAGRVVDAQGAPASGAQVHVTELASESEGVSATLDVEVDCDEQGAFSVRGETRSTRVKVRAQSRTAQSEERQFERGAADLLLTLVEGGSIAGQLLLDPEAASEALSVRLRPSSPAAKARSAELERNGALSAKNLVPGLWTLEVKVAGTRDALATVEGLLVPSGGPCVDARLESIDLRGRLTTVRLELVPPRPSDRVLGVVVVTPKSPDGEPFERMLHDRRLVLAVASKGVDLRIETSGFRTVHRPDARGDLRVELVRGPPVRLRVPLGAELPKPPYYLKPFLKPVGSTSTMVGHFQDAALGADREVVVYASGAGEFEVEWLLEKRLESSLTTSPLSVPEPQRIQVLDSDAEQVIDLRLPSEEIAHALERGL